MDAWTQGNMVICKTAHGKDSMSIDVHEDVVRIEIDDGEECCTSFDMSIADATIFFAVVDDIVARQQGARD